MARKQARPKWGEGKAPLLGPVTTASDFTAVFLSDPHFPYQDDDVISSAVRLVKKVKPEVVVLNGDTTDFWQVSPFNRARRGADDLQGDIDLSNAYRWRLRKAAPDAILIETEGNHDWRLRRYIEEEATFLSSLRALTIPELMEHADLELRWYGSPGVRLLPHFLARHGSYVRKDAGASAKAEFEDSKLSGTSGHTHRLGIHRVTSYRGVEQWGESGCLSRVDPDYVKGGLPNWQQGALVGHFSTKSTALTLEALPAIDGKLFYGGRLI